MESNLYTHITRHYFVDMESDLKVSTHWLCRLGNHNLPINMLIYHGSGLVQNQDMIIQSW